MLVLQSLPASTKSFLDVSVPHPDAARSSPCTGLCSSQDKAVLVSKKLGGARGEARRLQAPPATASCEGQTHRHSRLLRPAETKHQSLVLPIPICVLRTGIVRRCFLPWDEYHVLFLLKLNRLQLEHAKQMHLT